MKFSEKLSKLTAAGNKTQMSRDAGLRDTAISEMIAKDATPRSDSALKLARVLKVPLDWLVDDEADFPVPDQGGRSLRDYTDTEVMIEVARRLVTAIEAARIDLVYLSELDWRAIATELYSAETDSPPIEQLGHVTMADSVFLRISSLYDQFDARRYTDRLPDNAGRRPGKQVAEEIHTLHNAMLALKSDNAPLVDAIRFRNQLMHGQPDDWKAFVMAERAKTLGRLKKSAHRPGTLRIEGREFQIIDRGTGKPKAMPRAAKTFDLRRHPEMSKKPDGN